MKKKRKKMKKMRKTSNGNGNVFRRKSDDIIIGLVQTYQKTTEAQQQKLGEIKETTKEILIKMDNILIPSIQKHEKVLYGNPEKPGEYGVISELQNVKKDIKQTKSVFAAVWGVIVTGANVVISGLLGKR